MSIVAMAARPVRIPIYQACLFVMTSFYYPIVVNHPSIGRITIKGNRSPCKQDILVSGSFSSSTRPLKIDQDTANAPSLFLIVRKFSPAC